MSRQSENVKAWRRRTKRRIIEAMGGNCVCCGYEKCDSALELHHIDRRKKDFGFGAIRANIRSWKTIVAELRKCVLLCANCHREFHDNLIKLPKYYNTFNEDYVEYEKALGVKKHEQGELLDRCPVCKNLKPKQQKTCSLSCAGKRSWRVDWDNIDLIQLKQSYSNIEIAEMLDISEAAVRKRYKKLMYLKA